MELYWFWMSAVTLFTCYIFVNRFVRRLNEWHYELKLREKQYSLPPGDMGWPLIGNSLVFMKNFKSDHPDLFINNLLSKYGRTGIYKTHLFWNPSIIICAPELCKQVLTDDENFKLGYPKSVSDLAKSRQIYHVSNAQHKRVRRHVTAPIVGHNALAMYLERIEEIIMNSLEEMSSMKHPFEFLKEMKKVSFKAIIHVFLGSHNQNHLVTEIGDLFTEMHNALYSIPLNLPGFPFRKALKARKKLVKIVQSVIDERRLMIENDQMGQRKDLVDILLHFTDDNGQKLEDEDIIDLLLGFLLAGRESTAFAMMCSIIYLTQHPHTLKKAMEEQEEIMKTRPPSQKRISIQEIKQMVYLSQVIDETLRLANLAFSVYREAIDDVNINGYIIPKGWRVLVWTRAIHMNPEYFSNPEEFNPSRWDDHTAKARSFFAFGAGSRFCPGRDLAKLEISIFLHYFLLNYKLERVNPDCPWTGLPATMPIDKCLTKVTKISRA